MDVFPKIDDYFIQELVAEGKHTMVYRAQRKADQRPVIIKLLKTDSVALKNVEQLTHEFNMLSKVHSPFVVKALELVPIQNNIILAMEDFHGKPLSHFLNGDNRDLLLNLEIAIHITTALGDIHHQNIIHKDIKPQNILVNLETKETKIIDFGIATQLSREMQTTLIPEQIEGSIAYMSPEQTGRMNRNVDYRSDLYSLGVTLYQLFTKKLPFEASTSLELIHMHITQQPQPPNEINKDIPPMLSDIILKCMSKEAEFRYHSAFGALYDLEKCRQNLIENPQEQFEIGTRDVYDHFSYPEKLYGRQRELNFINQCFKEVWSGNTLLLTLSGYSGVGKSSLVFEAQKHLPRGSGRFAYAKFDQFKHAIPYHALIQAFQVIIHQLLSEPDDVLQEWKERILEAVGDSGKVLSDVIPEIELIIGVQPSLEKISPLENANRFNFVMVNFLKSLLQPDSPLVLFIDDLHWADEPSLKLIELFFSDPTVHNFLIIATYRDNEVTPFHPLSITLREIASHGSTVLNLSVDSLSPEAIQQMIQDIFFGPPKQAEELTQLLYRKTQGNPFFTLQLLKLLYEKELFVFDKGRGYWKAKLDEIAASHVSDNVADLVIAKLKNLPEDVLEILKIGATVENRFDLDLLTYVSGFSREKIIQLLSLAQQEDLIFQEKVQTGFFAANLPESEAKSPITYHYRFLHDRIQQATYSLLGDQERLKLHYTIGTAILQHTPKPKLAEKIIDIVNHLNAADPALLSDQEKVDLIHLNLAAGHRAKDSAAYHSAIQYYSKGVSLLGEEGWSKKYGWCLEMHQNLALCLMITGSIEKAEEHFDLCLANAKTILEKSELYTDFIFLYGQIQQYGRSLETGVKALKLFGFDYSIQPSRLSLVFDLVKHKFKMLFRKVEDMEQLPLATDQNIQAILKIVSALLYFTFVMGNKTLFAKSALTIIELSWKHGITKQTCTGLVTFGMALGSEMFRDYEQCYRYGTTAHNLAIRFPNTAEMSGSLYLYFAFIHRWKNPLRMSILPLKKNFRKVLECGATTMAAANAVYISLIPLVTGENLSNVLNSIQEGLLEIKKLSSKSEEMSLLVLREVCLSLKGLNPDPINPRPVELTDELLQASKSNNQYILFALRYDVWRMVLLYLFGKYSEAASLAEKCIERTASVPNWIETHVLYLFFSLSLTALLQKPEDNPKQWKQLKHNYKLLKRWADASPTNYTHYMLLVEAEMARIQNASGVVKLYEQAIKAAKKSGCTQDIAVAYELFGNYYQAHDFKELGSILYHKALEYYTQWGAEAKCTHFKNEHASDLSLETLSLSSLSIAKTRLGATEDTTSVSTKTLGASSSELSRKGTESSDFDVNTLIDASQALSKEIVLDKLMESLMHVVIVNAGGDKAFLILFENKKGKVYSKTYLNQKYMPLVSPIPIEEMGQELCLAAIKYVNRTNRELLLNNASEEGNFRDDPYILKNMPKSLLCIPLIQKGTLAGVLYLENNATKNAFTPKRVRLLSLLSSQMAISIENAQFYAKLEYKVQDRTKELQERNQELQQALQMIKTVQEQMIQQEKLASLGLLTSGIAHELKNPLNFVINFSLIAKDHIQDFMYSLRNYLTTLKGEMFSSLEKMDNVNKDQFQELMQQLHAQSGIERDLLDSFEKEVLNALHKVDEHGHRADNIIQGMLAHAHQGSKAAEPVEINNLVEQAYNLTYHNHLKKNPKFNISVEKRFDPGLKTIFGFPGDLIRIFINILDNAFYAQAELCKANTSYVPLLLIKTELKDSQAVITIRDNGPGIPHQFIDKIFQPFFTTKPTGSGTGLGLSIAYDIITKEHRGSITVQSEKDQFSEFVISLPVDLRHESGVVPEKLVS